MTTKSLDTIIENIRELADEYPDVVYSLEDTVDTGAECSYFKGEAGPGEGCIVGQASLSSLIEEAGLDDKSTAGNKINHLRDKGYLTDVTRHKRNWVGQVQSLQDDEVAWGEAVNRADDEFGIEPGDLTQ